ncbi:hypothetical protein DdX_11294 [Ditylenchus destructor]|uniref:Uncharacterized protein n=1 Tax=Ditylenchus destructor TaxID=166010 RepID=A0AAD4R4K7_9BILA|nr:hypothetical protein DdX_11294 [Ditylenchus destructor]
MAHRYQPSKLYKRRITTTKNPRTISRKKNDSPIKNKTIYKESVAINLDDSQGLAKSTNVKEQLRKMELLAWNLIVQLILCIFALIFTVTVYFENLKSECWALPFQENPCKKPRALPLMTTNQSTLADAVDEFVLALKPEISIFHDVVEVPFTLLRQSLFAFTKIRIGQLLNQHSADLVAFGALKREDERLEELELAIEEGYIQIFTFQFALVIFLCCVAIPILLLGFLKPTEKTEQKKSSAEERENSQNSRLTKLKRRISFLYIATLLCIVAEFILFSMFVAGIYQGNSPTFQSNKGFKCNETDSFDILRRCQLKVSFSDYRSFSTELESTLDKRIAKLGTSMISPNLEVRQLTYEHQSEAITTAIEHHLSLKQYKVDRRTMPRKIGNVLPGSELIPLVFVNNCFLFSAFFLWVGWGGSVWQVFPCVRYLIRCFS